MSLFEELRRRNVFRVAIGYIITAWLLLQVVDLVLENINAPDWVMQVFMLALAIGFPLAVFFAWAFEMTPDGVKRESEVDRTKTITKKTGRKMDRHIIIAMALALAYFSYDKFSGPDQDSVPPITQTTSAAEDSALATDSTPVTKTSEKSVAVLPFVNMSDDKENEYFSDGISEELLNVLVKVKGLRVPSRTSSFTFKDSGKKLAEIGKELQVDHILEGSVRKSGDRIRVTAQLIEVNTDTHLWSETYTRQLDDIFAVQDEIASAIVNALRITLVGEDQTLIQNHSTTNADAYNKYLLGRHLWNQRSQSSLLASTEPLREAVEIDPGFGQAWAALADAYVLIPEYGAGPIQKYIPLAHDAIKKALASNPKSARALTTSAYIKFMYDYDLTGAHADFESAISIDPGYATAHQWYGELLATENKLDAALDELRLARQADPLAAVIPHVMGWVLMFTPRREEAFSYFEDALKLDPHLQSTINNLSTLNLMLGRFDQARLYRREHARLNEYDPAAGLALIDAVENPALKDQALKMLKENVDLLESTVGRPLSLMILDEQELALDSLEQNFAAGDPYAIHMNRMDVFDPLRDNPRYQALLKKMNMWP
jgi:TolB-like protein/Tfp pilus assembly protein PilF